MNAVPSLSNPYNKGGSIFTFSRNIFPGFQVTVPADQSFDLAVIQFDDNGSSDRAQLDAAAKCIEEARKRSDTGAVVVVFIHGWHHDASWDISSNEGDEHFKEFRRILMTLALREVERGQSMRRVVGVYLSWNGDPPLDSWLGRLRRVPFITYLTFWDRICKAKTIAQHQDIRDTIAGIVKHTKEKIQDRPTLPESPLIFIGHSMGALILESAILWLLRKRPESLIKSPQPSTSVYERPIRITSKDQPITCPDLVLLLNSAADSRDAKKLITELKDKKMSKFVETKEISFRPPLVISATSPRDLATRVAWRFANVPWHKTEGHDSSLFSHTLECTGKETKCTAKGSKHLMVSFGQAWHCLRRPKPPKTDRPSFPIDLPKAVPLNEQEWEKPQHVRYILKPIEQAKELRHKCEDHDVLPFWVFRVPTNISAKHNDIFSARCSLLILALMQIAGATVSIAERWEDVFEEEST